MIIDIKIIIKDIIIYNIEKIYQILNQPYGLNIWGWLLTVSTCIYL